MATKWTHWLNEHEALVDYGQQAPSPSKDFFHIFVTPNEFIYRLWKIVPPTRSDYQNNPPSEVRNSWEDFPLDDRLHSELQRVGGSKTLDYLLNLANGHLDYLPRLPRNMLIQIIMMLDLEDIKALSLVSHFFKELCNCNELWEKIYRQNSETPITDELQSLAREHGWKGSVLHQQASVAETFATPSGKASPSQPGLPDPNNGIETTLRAAEVVITSVHLVCLPPANPSPALASHDLILSRW